MTKLRITTLLTLKTPLHITEPISAKWDPDSSQWTNSDRGWPAARTKSIPIIVANGDTPRSTALIPGNSLRGGLRRSAADLVLKLLEQRGEKIPFDLYHIILCGSASASPDKNTATITEAAEAAKHPFAALFGGGPKLVWSRLSVGPAFPITADTLGSLVPTTYQDRVCPTKVTAVPISTKVDDVLRGTGVVPGAIENLAGETSAWVAKLQESKQKIAAETDAEPAGKKATLQTVYAKEVIIPGTVLHAEHIVDTLDAEPDQSAMVGLFVVTLANFAKRQRIGGNYREGWGRFVLEATFMDSGGNTADLLLHRDDAYAPNMQHPTIAGAVRAWEDYAAKMTAADLAKAFSVK